MAETIGFNEFKKLDLRIAEIKTVEDVEGKDKLYKLTIEVGEKEKILVAGIKQQYPKEELVGKQIIIVNNLQPAKIGGILSEGMLLAAYDSKNLALLTVDKRMETGTLVE